MDIKIVDLTVKNMADLPEWESPPFSCKYCLYWENPERYASLSTDSKEEWFDKKLAWLERTRSIAGNCGKLLYLQGKPAGYASYAPPEFLPASGEYPAGPVSMDAFLLACLFIPGRELRMAGLGSQLLTRVLEDLKRRGVQALETFARWGKTENPSGPVEFYLKHGFEVLHADPEFPLLRFEFKPTG